MKNVEWVSVVRLTVIHTYDGGQDFQFEVAIFVGDVPPIKRNSVEGILRLTAR